MKLLKNDILMCTTCESWMETAGHLAVVLGPSKPIGNLEMVEVSFFETEKDGAFLQEIPANGSDDAFVKVGVL